MTRFVVVAAILGILGAPSNPIVGVPLVVIVWTVLIVSRLRARDREVSA